MPDQIPAEAPDQNPEKSAVSSVYSSLPAIPLKKLDRKSSVDIPLGHNVDTTAPPPAKKTSTSPTRTRSVESGPDQTPPVPPIKILGSDGIGNKIKFFESRKEGNKSFELDGKASAPNLDLPGFEPFKRGDEKQDQSGKKGEVSVGDSDLDSDALVKPRGEEKGPKDVDLNTSVTSKAKFVRFEDKEVCTKEAEKLLDINDSIIADIEGLLELSDGVTDVEVATVTEAADKVPEVVADVNPGVATVTEYFAKVTEVAASTPPQSSIVSLREATKMFRLSKDVS